MVEEQVALGGEDVLDGGGHDLVVVAPVPPVLVLPDEGGVVAGLHVADVVDDGEEGVLVVLVPQHGVRRRRRAGRGLERGFWDRR